MRRTTSHGRQLSQGPVAPTSQSTASSSCGCSFLYQALGGGGLVGAGQPIVIDWAYYAFAAFAASAGSNAASFNGWARITASLTWAGDGAGGDITYGWFADSTVASTQRTFSNDTSIARSSEINGAMYCKQTLTFFGTNNTSSDIVINNAELYISSFDGACCLDDPNYPPLS